MEQEQILRKLEGLHTVETVMDELAITKQSAINLLSRLKKQYFVKVRGGGRKKRLYKITMRRQFPRVPGMFDIINKYSPNMKLAPWYDHQVHGKYTVEDALVDAVQTESFRVILASLHLFKHIKNWPKLYKLAKKHDCWQKIGALYDVAKMYFRVRKKPREHSQAFNCRWVRLTQLNKKNFPIISNKWHVYIPFNENDVREA